MLATVVECDPVYFRGSGELGLLAMQFSLGLGNLHAFAGSGTDEVRFEFGDHSKDVGEEFASGVDEGLLESGALAVLAGDSVVDVDQVFRGGEFLEPCQL